MQVLLCNQTRSENMVIRSLGVFCGAWHQDVCNGSLGPIHYVILGS